MSEHHQRVIEELGILGIKTLTTVNAGAFIVLLTFVGNTSADSSFLLSPYHLEKALISFGVGLFFVFATIAIAYFNTLVILEKRQGKLLSNFWYFAAVSILPASFGAISFFVGVFFAIAGVTAS